MFIDTLRQALTLHGQRLYTANDFRQTLRIVLAGMIALGISCFYNTTYTVFYVIYPMMLLSLVPVFNRFVVKQFLCGAMLSCIMTMLFVGCLSQWPLIMTLAVFSLYILFFRLMSQGTLFLLGSIGVVCQSALLNFMSYPTTDWHTLIFSIIEASVMALGLSAVMYTVLPDVEPRGRPPLIVKDPARVRHESLLAATVATLIFIVFQICDLSDSLAALMAGVLVLFPMHYRGAVLSSLWRVVGATLGGMYVLLAQLLLYSNDGHLLLMMPLVAIGLAFSVRLHVIEKVGAGVGFSCFTTIAIMFGQSLHPGNDLVFSDLWRIISVVGSILITLTLVFIIHLLLNRFAATRYIPSPPGQ